MRNSIRRVALAGTVLAVTAPAFAQRFVPPGPYAAAQIEDVAVDVTTVQVAVLGLLVLLVAFFLIRGAMRK